MRKSLFAVFALLLTLPYLMAPSGGFPFTPTFGKVNVIGSSLPVVSVRKANQTCPSSGNTYAMEICTPNSGTANGLRIHAGTSVSDNAFVVTNAADSTNFLVIAGDGTPSGTLFASGSFTATLATGCTTTPTFTVNYYKVGAMVTLWTAVGTGAAFVSCTGNATSRVTDASLPVLIRPATDKPTVPIDVTDNSVAALACAKVTSTGTLSWTKSLSGSIDGCTGSNWTNSGSTTIGSFSVTYTTN